MVEGLDSDRNAFEDSLKCIHSLECQFRDAHTKTNTYETAQNDLQQSQVNPLLDELVASGCTPTMVSAITALTNNVSIVYLTSYDTFATHTSLPANCNKNKIKKYVEITNIYRVLKTVKKYYSL